jgi:gluconate 2-dehydrogenase gamma chain
MSDQPDRRTFLRQLGTVGATGVVAIAGGPPVKETAVEPQQQAAPAEPAPYAYTFCTPPEAAFVEAAVDRFIPADELTPSGTACGVAVFIDRQLAGAWGNGDRLYMQGPWQKGAPTQGYQSPMSPAEFIRNGIAATNAYCRKTYQKDFDRLSEAQQIAVLEGLEQNRIALDRVPGQEFFNLLLNAAMEGFFADPIYGGNKNKVSWKMLGFPGVVAIYSEHIKTYRNRRYDVQTASIADLS